ncbi:MAG: ATP synthase F0 subunit B [Planctomycetota bacterium]
MVVRLVASFAVAFLASPVLAAAPVVADEVQAETTDFPAETDGAEPASDGAEGAESAAEEAEPEGLPASPKPDLAIWSIVVFGLFVTVLTVMAWKPASAGLNKREQRIRDDLAAAEKNRVESERLMAQHAAEMAKAQEQVKEILAEARRDAEVARQNILTDAQTAAKADRDRALHDIEQAKDQAMAELFSSFNDQLAAATEHVLGKSLTDDTQQKLIDQSISEFRGSRA